MISTSTTSVPTTATFTPLTATEFFVDNSTLEAATTCPWLGYAQVIRRRRPSGEAPALRFGGFIHRALAYRYKMLAYGRNPTELSGSYIERNMLRILDHCFQSTPCETEGWRNLDNAHKVIRGYNRAWPNEEFTVALNSNRYSFPFVEQPFAVDTGVVIRGRRIIYTGRIDLVIRLQSGQIFIFDHKTTSMLGDSFWNDQAITPQHRGYCWAFARATGIVPDGYEVNAIAGRESLSRAYFDEVTGTVRSMDGRSKAAPVEYTRQRFFTKVPEDQLTEWYENMLACVDEFLYHVDRQFFPRHRKHCVGKYGQCAFYNVCSLPQASREGALTSSAYEQNEWTPLYL